MTDAQMLQNLLAVYEMMVSVRDFIGGGWKVKVLDAALSALKEVIAELRRRVELEKRV